MEKRKKKYRLNCELTQELKEWLHNTVIIKDTTIAKYVVSALHRRLVADNPKKTLSVDDILVLPKRLSEKRKAALVAYLDSL